MKNNMLSTQLFQIECHFLLFLAKEILKYGIK